MQGKDAIINKIISDSEDKAKEIIDNANSIKDNKINEAKLWAKEYTNAQEKILNSELEEIVRRKLIVAELDSKKLILSAKQEEIGKTFDKAYELLCKLSKKDYLSLVEKMLNMYAEKEDCVLLSSDGVISSKDISDLPIFVDRKLSVSKDKGDFIGGFMLIGKVCDKDLTFKSVLEYKREQLSSEIADKLFN